MCPSATACTSSPAADLHLHSSIPASSSAPLVATLHVIGRQHARLAGPLDGAVHPALVDWLSVDDHVAVAEGNLVVVLRCVVVQRPIDALQQKRQKSILTSSRLSLPEAPAGNLPFHHARKVAFLLRSAYRGDRVRRGGDGSDGRHAGLVHVAVMLLLLHLDSLVISSRKDRS